ncbi:PTS sugar transporter subunit IIA [Oceanobacillus alkalisoli]|uniref:PTS sugar transporter subunit IIA n=1 Tax=Oceanobacillus alkalisoli TaxID=2925113 RepID=UPI001EF04287|nr:PTS sugar transporter subunit IIA [Oceanobacillus alkalisoli]MCF3944099.1 PTS sugar transporter subunit IIA [Oceanobacillus alkalisoli]MCG5102506.1 PTS sugar transporter subunit IIA [Oceanobacillus alkalisoli]
MIGILIVTHGKFSTELLNSAELIVGKQVSVNALNLNADDDIHLLKKEVELEATKLDTGEGVLVLTDLYGGSPFNVTAANMKQRNMECLTGVNLPMLIEALSLRGNSNLQEVTNGCCKAGIEGIKNVRQELF